MNYRHNLISLNTDGDDLSEEFKIILDIIEKNLMDEHLIWAYRFHQEMEFGPRWRIITFHIIDTCADTPEERIKLLSCLTVMLSVTVTDMRESQAQTII